ncbi:MAG: energy-coupled thiamine transporter ThiT [Oscillospiraceae bacterium]|nr:energy-coupled thiamine transporter ThiT [Oscillospiraceae bacterium]
MTKTRRLCECAILLAMSVALSFVKIYTMPLGGSVTLLSMLPVLLVGLRHGAKWGFATTGLYALFQLAQAFMNGNVFPYCYTAAAVVVCVLFDYIIPFGILGGTGCVSVKSGKVKVLAVIAALVFVRFVCHCITGVVIWGQWAPEGMGKFIYSIVYNGQYMLPELVLTVLAAWALMSSKAVVKQLES